ncbi:hypothetical protein INR49_008182 [Caranx melampygus]|nr:hypothetical protein INR49_008182 [Caranx melampygus]
MLRYLWSWKGSRASSALAVLSHTPEGATQTIAWGEGHRVRHGGLSIKGKTTMPGMKRDCGGAAAILGAFRATIKQGFKDNLHAVFCLAENAVGTSADPMTSTPSTLERMQMVCCVCVFHEGRWRSTTLMQRAGWCWLMGWCTPAKTCQLISLWTWPLDGRTGDLHREVPRSGDDQQRAVGGACVRAGRSSGDLAHPLVYCPELHFSEFTSAMADMKNSVAVRSRERQSSCAGLFIGSHLGFDWPGVWVHVDIASPVHAVSTEHRGASHGFGVAMLMALFGQASDDSMLNQVSPLGAATNVSEDQMERDCKRRRLV